MDEIREAFEKFDGPGEWSDLSGYDDYEKMTRFCMWDRAWGMGRTAGVKWALEELK